MLSDRPKTKGSGQLTGCLVTTTKKQDTHIQGVYLSVLQLPKKPPLPLVRLFVFVVQ